MNHISLIKSTPSCNKSHSLVRMHFSQYQTCHLLKVHSRHKLLWLIKERVFLIFHSKYTMYISSNIRWIYEVHLVCARKEVENTLAIFTYCWMNSENSHVLADILHMYLDLGKCESPHLIPWFSVTPFCSNHFPIACLYQKGVELRLYSFIIETW